MADDVLMNRDTQIQHLGESDYLLGAVAPPLIQTSTFVFDGLEDFMGDHNRHDPCRCIYTRVANPTVHLAAKKIAAIENTEACALFASGMAAISSAILSCVQAGDHVILIDSVYGPTRTFLFNYLNRFGVTCTLVDGRSTAAIEDAITPKTTLIYLESPSSVLFRHQDLAAIAAIAKPRGIVTAIDSTYSAGHYMRPADLGIDLVIHSVTKYFAGHSDVVAGCVCGTSERINALIAAELQLLGGCISPFNAWLIIRGLRSLPSRLRTISRNGQALFDFLKDRPEVAEIYFPGNPNDPQAELVARQMTGIGGLISILPQTQSHEAFDRFFRGLKLFKLGVSWGGHESLVVPVPMHPLDWPEQKFIIRLYAGLEDPEDLIADLNQALPHLNA